MKKRNLLFIVFILVLVSLACQAVSGGGDVVAPEQPLGEAEAEEGGEPEDPKPAAPPAELDSSVESEFPIPDGAKDAMNIGGTLNFQVEMTIEEGLEFYRAEFAKSGYVEREVTTVVSETMFSVVFDGHSSGKAIVVQGVDMGDGTININVRLEDI